MEAYSVLLERTRAPQPSLQRHAVVSIFRSSPPHDAVSQCLRSPSSAVVDQSVRELCRLVVHSQFSLSFSLLELQAALEGCDPRVVSVFVKGLGFLVRFGFRDKCFQFRVCSQETHPFVKILSCRGDVQSELLQQVLLFMSQNRSFGMIEVCDFLRPFLNFSIIKIPLSVSFSTFVKDVIASMSSFCCAFPLEAMPVIKLLLRCFRYFPSKNAGESLNLCSYMGFILDAYIVVLKHLVEMGRLVTEAQQCGVEILETFFSLLSDQFKCSGGIELIVEASKHLLNVQKVLGLRYIPEFSTVVLSLFISLIQSEVEHEQLSILKLLLFLIKWKDENELMGGLDLCEELLFIFPVISLVSSPCKSVKQAAMDLLSMLENLLKKYLVTPEKDMRTRGEFRCISRPQDIIYRIFQRLLGQDQPLLYVSFVSYNSSADENVNHMQNVLETWSSLLRECSKQAVERRKSSVSVTQSQEIYFAEMPLLLGAIATVLVVHNERGSSAINLLTVIGSMDPKLCVPLLLLVLFYNHLLSGNDGGNSFQSISLKLLEMLPTLALRSMMTPFIVQTILPMLQKDAKPILYATATRLLCKAWETNDRVFGSLQGVLHPNGFTQFLSERNICLSMSASIRDVCKKNPDRGVDLILSVSACIESQDPVVKALGFESLSYLCEADVIDFYTAWDVISEHVMDFLGHPNVASSVCLLLRWGAMDAEAYPETAANVLTTLWKVGTSKWSRHEHLWSKARASAFEAISHYEVLIIQKSIPDFREMNIELITSEVDTEVLRAVGVLEVKIITFEHITRKRFSKEKRVPVTRVEKLLNVFPDVLFSSGNVAGARQLPGAALYFLSLTPEDGTKRHQNLQGLQDVHSRYETALVEIAASLQLSRNSLTALISMQSWKHFMQRWMRDCVFLLDAKTPSTVLDKTLKAGNGILKIIRRLALDSLPSSAENIALAMGALCEVLPPSAHSVKSSASTFLLDWLFQHEHEHRQWSAAISLGYISSCLHVTDHRQKFENIRALTEVALCSRSTLVKGACGIGLGFSCHDLLITTETFDISSLGKENYKLQEVVLLGKTVGALCQMICQFDPSESELLDSISVFFALNKDDDDSLVAFESSEKNCDDLEEDVWGIAGLVIGLGSSIGALYRAGAHEVVHKIKAFIISRILSFNSSARNFFSSKSLDMAFYVGSCLALPSLVTFCLRVELMHVGEIDNLVNGVREIISELLSVKKSGTLYQSLLMGSCVGGGSLLGCILNEGVYSLGVEVVKDILSLFRKTYSDPHPPLIHFGGMLGVVNALGVGAGTFVYSYPKGTLAMIDDQKQAPFVTAPLLSSPVVEPQVTSMIQEMFLVAQNSDDPQLQHYAAWTVSFLRHHLYSKEVKSVEIGIPSKTGGQTSVSQYFPEDSVAMKLSLWLMHLKNPETCTCSSIYTVSAVLQCLSQAPRLPSLDWVAIVRRCMTYEGQVAELSPDFNFKRGIVREECIKLSISHAAQFSPLLSFIDELTNLPRFRMLELNLQSWILSHLSDLIKVFSGSRLEKLIDDITDFLLSISGDEACNFMEKSLLRTSCWKGIYECLDGNSADSQEYVSNLGKCMEVLFSLLPPLLHSAGSTELAHVQSEEWSAGVRCLAKAKQSWLLELLQVSQEKMIRRDCDFSVVAKKVQAKARLVQTGSIPLSELGKLKAYLLDTRLDGVWDVLLEVVACLQHVEVSVKRQWLVDALEISCVTNYPSTAMQFVSLLCGSFSKYMPLLIVDQNTVLSDLPVTLSSLLSDSNWAVVAEAVALLMLSSTQRIYDWATRVAQGEESLSAESIDSSENDKADYLLRVMHYACVCLKDYLPPEKQLKLANLAV